MGASVINKIESEFKFFLALLFSKKKKKNFCELINEMLLKLSFET